MQLPTGGTHTSGASSTRGARSPDPTRQPIYASSEDRLDAAEQSIRDAYAPMLENVPPIWIGDPGMVIEWATNALVKLMTGRTSQGAPLTRAERIYLSRGLVRAYVALKDLEQKAERAEDGALVYHSYGEVRPWTKERPHTVEDLPPFRPGPQLVWRSLAGLDPEAGDVAPTARRATSGEGEEPGSPTRRRTAPKLAHTITFRKPEGVDVTTDEGKLGILGLVVRAIYRTMDDLLLKWVVLQLGTTLPDGKPRFNDEKWLTEFSQKKVGEEITITADEKFTIELDLLLLHAPDRVGLIGAEVYRGSVGMYFIVGAEFAAFLVAITGGAGLGLVAAEGGSVAMSGAAVGLETAVPTFGSAVTQGATSLYLTAGSIYTQVAPAVTFSMATTTAYYGTQAASEGHFGEWASENLNAAAEQYFTLQPTGLFYNPTAPQAQESSVAADVAGSEATTPPATVAATEETSLQVPVGVAATEETLVPPPVAAEVASGEATTLPGAVAATEDAPVQVPVGVAATEETLVPPPAAITEATSAITPTAPAPSTATVADAPVVTPGTAGTTVGTTPSVSAPKVRVDVKKVIESTGAKVGQPQVRDINDPSKIKLGPKERAVYVLRESNGEIVDVNTTPPALTTDDAVLKVGRTKSPRSAKGRFGVYAGKAKEAGKAVTVDVYPVRMQRGRKIEYYEGVVRKALKAEGHDLPWDHSGKPGSGFGTPGEGKRNVQITRGEREELLRAHQGNLSEVGRELGGFKGRIHERTVQLWAQNLGLRAADFKPGGKAWTATPRPTTPSSTPTTPQVVTEAPKVVTEAPKVVTEAPKVVTEAPKVVTEAPKVVTEAPKVVTETPKVVTETPKVDTTTATTEPRPPTHIEGSGVETSHAGMNTTGAGASGDAMTVIATGLSAIASQQAGRDTDAAVQNLRPRIIEMLRAHPGMGVIVQVVAKRAKPNPAQRDPLAAPVPWQFESATPLPAYWQGSERDTWRVASEHDVSIGPAVAGGADVYGPVPEVEGYEWSRHYVWIRPLTTPTPSTQAATARPDDKRREAAPLDVTVGDFLQLSKAMGLKTQTVLVLLQHATRTEVDELGRPLFTKPLYIVDLGGGLKVRLAPRDRDALVTAYKERLVGILGKLRDRIDGLQRRLDKIMPDNPRLDPHMLDAPRLYLSKAVVDGGADRFDAAFEEIGTANQLLDGTDTVEGIAHTIADHE